MEIPIPARMRCTAHPPPQGRPLLVDLRLQLDAYTEKNSPATVV